MASETVPMRGFSWAKGDRPRRLEGCRSARSAGAKCSSVLTVLVAPGDNYRTDMHCRTGANGGYGGGYNRKRPDPSSCDAGVRPLSRVAIRAR